MRFRSRADTFHLIAGSADNYSNLNYGGVASRDESLHELAQTIQEYLEEPDSCVVFENTLAKPNDPYIRRSKFGLAIHGDEVYHWLGQDEHQLEYLETFIKEPRYPVALTGFLTRIQWSDGPVSG
jgi:hypothetical protein